MSRFALALVLLATPMFALPVSVHQQCGGIGYEGSTECEAGSECAPLHPHYWQCIPSPVMSDALAAAAGGSQPNRLATVTVGYAQGALAAPGPNVDTLLPVRTIMPQQPFSGRLVPPEPTQG